MSKTSRVSDKITVSAFKKGLTDIHAFQAMATIFSQELIDHTWQPSWPGRLAALNWVLLLLLSAPLFNLVNTAFLIIMANCLEPDSFRCNISSRPNLSYLFDTLSDNSPLSSTKSSRPTTRVTPRPACSRSLNIRELKYNARLLNSWFLVGKIGTTNMFALFRHIGWGYS